MKQTIEYYYELKIDELLIENNNYHFSIDNEDYYFLPFLKDESSIKTIIEMSRELKERGIDCHDILLNIKHEVLTKIDEVNYVLLKVRDKDKTYSIFDMINLHKKIKVNDFPFNNWATLWSKKIDYIENQLNEIKTDNIINLSIDYYIGLAENAIYYVNSISEQYKNENKNLALCHKRVYYPNIKLNYLNPLNFIFDLEVRDIAEYIKAVFWANEDALLELQTYLEVKKLTPFLYNMLFARLLYPSYYFDAYERVVNNHENSEIIIKYLNRADQYEEFLKKAYQVISSYAKLLTIDYFIY